MSNYLSHLKKGKQNPNNRWIVKYTDKGIIKEVKLIFNPKEYASMKNAKELLTCNDLIKLLENDKKNRTAK
jgi:hypothetical protein